MAADVQINRNSTDKDEESSPLLENQEPLNDAMKSSKPESCELKKSPPPLPPCKLALHEAQERSDWTADGVPLGMVLEAVGRAPWLTGASHCLGQQDEFFSSDLEVCMLGSVAPCVLYGSNVQRLTQRLGLSEPTVFRMQLFI